MTPTDPVQCVVVNASGNAHTQNVRHEEAHVVLGGSVTLIGGDESGHFVVARDCVSSPTPHAVNPLCRVLSSLVYEPKYGTLLVGRVDDDGTPIDVARSVVEMCGAGSEEHGRSDNP